MTATTPKEEKTAAVTSARDESAEEKKSFIRRAAEAQAELGNATSFFVNCLAAVVMSAAMAVPITWALKTATGAPAFDIDFGAVSVIAAFTSFIVAMPMVVFIIVTVDIIKDVRDKLSVAAKKAEAASRSKSTFLANMSHEIRTPLNGVLGMAQVLESTRLDDDQRDYVAAILDSGRTLTSLLNDVLDISKIEAGKFDIAPVDVDIRALLERQVRLWEGRASEKFLELTLNVADDVPEWLSFDQVRVQQCLSNLISNAIKFTETGGVTVRVSSTAQGDDSHLIEIRVIDTGSGVDAQTLSRLFQPFAQADETTSINHGGTGLGLSITRRLAELMGGGAEATSKVGEGSTFMFSFAAPAADAPAAPDDKTEVDDAEKALATLAGAPLKILIVDDMPLNRRIAALFLNAVGADIEEAENGAAALDALAAKPFDVVLLDMRMPVMDGPETVAAIRASPAAWRDTPLIALTADAMGGDREKYLALGADGYVSKPVDERSLLSELLRVMSDRPPACERRTAQEDGGRRAAPAQTAAPTSAA